MIPKLKYNLTTKDHHQPSCKYYSNLNCPMLYIYFFLTCNILFPIEYCWKISSNHNILNMKQVANQNRFCLQGSSFFSKLHYSKNWGSITYILAKALVRNYLGILTKVFINVSLSNSLVTHYRNLWLGLPCSILSREILTE